jgi:hypothetical protein
VSGNFDAKLILVGGIASFELKLVVIVFLIVVQWFLLACALCVVNHFIVIRRHFILSDNEAIAMYISG